MQAQIDVAKNQVAFYQEAIANAERKLKNAYIFMNVAVPVLSMIPITIGFIEMGNDNVDRGWNYIKLGGITLLSCEIVLQGGHFIFKFW